MDTLSQPQKADNVECSLMCYKSLFVWMSMAMKMPF